MKIEAKMATSSGASKHDQTHKSSSDSADFPTWKQRVRSVRLEKGLPVAPIVKVEAAEYLPEGIIN